MRTTNRLLLVSLLVVCPVVFCSVVLCPVFAVAAEDAPSAEPDVTIHTEGDKLIQEYRQNGFIYAIKVTPAHGKPYFLVRADGTDANFIRSDYPDMLIPSWVVFSW